MRNMPKRYSEMTPHELREEIGVLKEQAVKAEQLGIVNEFDVLMRKMAMARAYMTDINEFQIGETYELVEEPGASFTITYFNGVFAWGHKQNETEEIGIPISLLQKK
ncbi:MULTISPECIES: YfhH family protein [unclassified Bacillus (in: firmicutes)]|uniref:YfhH family protein n=1 Tax=unclassified Bacillus (in: firmicutes) TaxID=185979 RepID=UPI00232D89B6|nr:YfhH family protein [Bacillus sp. BP-3]MDC2865449.1 YfhH family protein [Bacillus sp. BP-3]